MMIPATKKSAVTQALQTAFGVQAFESITAITIGLSQALVFKMVVKGNPYLLRVITSTAGVNEPTQFFTCMEIAAAAGLAPRIYYQHAKDGILITDFIEAQPFPIAVARKKLPVLLNQLHALPGFPYRINYFERMHGFIQKLMETAIDPEPMNAELIQKYNAIKACYPSNNLDGVSCHNDLKPENILYDGDRVWLVDWEAAFLNDRYLDLAEVANFLVTTEQEEIEFLTTYFGKAPDEYQRARFYLMQLLLHFYFYGFLILVVHNKGHNVEQPHTETPFRWYHHTMWAGGINLSSDEAKITYAWVHRNQFLQQCRLPRFEESIRIVAHYHSKEGW